MKGNLSKKKGFLGELGDEDILIIADIIEQRVSGRIDALETTVSDKKTELSDAQADIEALEAELSGTKTELSGTKTELSEVKTNVSDIEADITALESGKEDVSNRWSSVRGAYPKELDKNDARYASLYFMQLREEDLTEQITECEQTANKITDTDGARPGELWQSAPFEDAAYFNANVVGKEFYKVHSEITKLQSAQGNGGEYRLYKDASQYRPQYLLQKKQADGTWEAVEESDCIDSAEWKDEIERLDRLTRALDAEYYDLLNEHNYLKNYVEESFLNISRSFGSVGEQIRKKQNAAAVEAYTAEGFESTAGSTVSLKPDTEIRIKEAVTELSVALATDTSWTDIENCGFCFISGDVPTTLTYSSTPIKWVGADCDSEGDFIPAKNTRYEVSVKYIMTKDLEQEHIVTARVGVF